ncbi:hypothetical protein, partial [Ferrovum sp.]|uniref:hypothetical protein n=1 Tax=Ferrovum sp. TaxID=2609467 RepID=UPI0026216089
MASVAIVGSFYTYIFDSSRLLKNADLFSLTRSGGSIFQQIFSFLSGNMPIFRGNPRFPALWADFW